MYLAAVLACLCALQAARISRLSRTLRTLRWDHIEAGDEARSKVEQLERKVAEYESLTGSWTADLIEGGDA
jgi:hypothetical protein